MEMWIETCSLQEWANKAQKITDFKGSLESFIAANIFSSLQYIEEEIEEKKRHQAFRLVISAGGEKIAVAWLSIYYLSDTVLRLRGLYVDAEYRRQGYMSFLLKEVLKRFEGQAQKVLSFSLPDSVGFHLRNQFRIEERFTPRPTIQENSNAPLTLLFYALNGNSSSN